MTSPSPPSEPTQKTGIRPNLLEKFPFLLSLKTSHRHQPGETIIREGEIGDQAYIIKSGFVEISLGDQLLDVLEPGEVLGEMAVLDEVNRSATAVAATDCELIVVKPEEFQSFASSHPEFFQFIMHIVMERLRRTNQLAESIMAASLSAIKTVSSGGTGAEAGLRSIARTIAETRTMLHKPNDSLSERPIDGRDGDGPVGRISRAIAAEESEKRDKNLSLVENEKSEKDSSEQSRDGKPGQLTRNGRKPKSEIKW